MSDSEPWAIAWTIPKRPLETPCWLMVKHIERGWELPGGSIRDGESIDTAALRELFEETGLLGTAKAVDGSLFENGSVVLIEVDEEPSPYGWSSGDASIEEAGWCVEIPSGLHWGSEEIQRMIDHDWRTSRSLES